MPKKTLSLRQLLVKYIIPEDCEVTYTETHVNKKVTRYPPSPAGEGESWSPGLRAALVLQGEGK